MSKIKRLLCKHKFKKMDGIMGFLCKVQCCKCGFIDDDFTNSEVTTFNITVSTKK